MTSYITLDTIAQPTTTKKVFVLDVNFCCTPFDALSLFVFPPACVLSTVNKGVEGILVQPVESPERWRKGQDRTAELRRVLKDMSGEQSRRGSYSRQLSFSLQHRGLMENPYKIHDDGTCAYVSKCITCVCMHTHLHTRRKRERERYTHIQSVYC